jgi:hypothetical protein
MLQIIQGVSAPLCSSAPSIRASRTGTEGLQCSTPRLQAGGRAGRAASALSSQGGCGLALGGPVVCHSFDSFIYLATRQARRAAATRHLLAAPPSRPPARPAHPATPSTPT